MPFVLKADSGWTTVFYEGKTYIYQYETYAATVTSPEQARHYKTKAGAEKSAKALNGKVWNYSFYVHET